eukprot:GDKH01002013.1.p1 GENE.GDKH01002013.1~~GDKH01002013.1.p1  ORF type:complete len:209 (+),score=16.79 GDKH01002013.1:53-679(+)
MACTAAAPTRRLAVSLGDLACPNRSTPLFRLEFERGPKLAKPRNWSRFWKIRKGDMVLLNAPKREKMSGADAIPKKVLQTDFLRNMVRVEGVNTRVIYPDGHPVRIEKKIHVSNVNLAVKGPDGYWVRTRVALKYTDEGEPIRIAKKTNTVIPWPEKVTRERNTSEAPEGPKDTSPEIALRKTYDYAQDVEALRIARQTMSKYNRTLD